MDKLTLTEIYKDTFKRSTLIAVPSIDELLAVEYSEFTKQEIFYSIVESAVLNYSKYYPLVVQQKMFINVDSGTRVGEVNDTFDNYISGIADESSVCIRPMSVQGLQYNGYVGSGYPLRNFRYENGKFWDFWYSTGMYYGNCICQYPMFEDYDPVTKAYTDKCAVYYIKKNLDSKYTIFRDEVYVQLCRYIMNIKKNMQLQNMPIELFNGLEEDYNNVKSDLQDTYKSAVPGSAWLI